MSIVMRFSTEVTPAADHATRSASCFSAHERTLPLSVFDRHADLVGLDAGIPLELVQHITLELRVSLRGKGRSHWDSSSLLGRVLCASTVCGGGDRKDVGTAKEEMRSSGVDHPPSPRWSAPSASCA